MHNIIYCTVRRVLIVTSGETFAIVCKVHILIGNCSAMVVNWAGVGGKVTTECHFVVRIDGLLVRYTP